VRRLARALRRRVGGGDVGITMIDVMVSTVVMSFVLLVFTTAMLQIYRSTDRTQTLSQAQSQVNTAFLRLDTQLRYAAAISKETTVNGDPYVEYLTSNTGSRVCAELRVHSGQLQQRTWTQPPAPTVPGPGNETPTKWVPLASTVTAATFTFRDADDTANFQRLEISLRTGTSATATRSSRQTDITFTALNTSLTTRGDTTECTELRAVP